MGNRSDTELSAFTHMSKLRNKTVCTSMNSRKNTHVKIVNLPVR